MAFRSMILRCAGSGVLLGACFFLCDARAEGNITLRLMAANLTSGNYQRYETPGLNILQGLKPDIVAIQEFNYASPGSAGINTPAAIREMLDTAFETNFVYFRESGYNIPNGIISRYPILASGSWVDSDVGVNDRGFAWARIDVPGTNDLYVVSVHLKASSSGSDIARRAAEVLELKALIRTNFPANAWTVVAGDFNIYSENEEAVAHLGSFLSDTQVPADLNGGTNTNRGRSERYDRVWLSFSLTNSLVPLVMPSHTLAGGLVFVSTNYAPLSEVSPVQFGDSTVAGMQHMAVIKEIEITLPVTNLAVPTPLLAMPTVGVLRWEGISNVSYTVQANSNLLSENWFTLGTAVSANTNFIFTDSLTGEVRRFYRVLYR
jgi:endonuclease/exonuclease/phosphatase family metal-dependent hydrolase